MSIVYEVLVIVNLILTVMAFPFIIILMVEYKSFNKSTHKIEYKAPPIHDVMPNDPFTDDMLEEGLDEKAFEKLMNPDDEFLE